MALWKTKIKMAATGSQEARLIRTLKMNNKYGTPNYVFPQMGILKYSSRIAELRQEGHTIVAEREEINGRKTGVWRYFYVDEPVGV